MFDQNKLNVTGIYNMTTVQSERGRYLRIVKRNWYALSFCEYGQITYMQRGERVVSDRNYAVFLPQGQSYELFGDSDGSFPLINFYAAEPFCDTVSRVRIKNPETYIADFEQMRRLSLFEGNGFATMTILYSMLHRMFTQSGSGGVLEPAMAYIESNFTEIDLDNERLAELCGISEVYFRRLFIEQYRMTPRQFLIDVRIKCAKQLLEKGGMKMSEIAEASGFGDRYHFSRMFRQKTGMTPIEYRKMSMQTEL